MAAKKLFICISFLLLHIVYLHTIYIVVYYIFIIYIYCVYMNYKCVYIYIMCVCLQVKASCVSKSLERDRLESITHFTWRRNSNNFKLHIYEASNLCFSFKLMHSSSYTSTAFLKSQKSLLRKQAFQTKLQSSALYLALL